MIKTSAFATNTGLPRKNTKINLNKNSNIEDISKIISKSGGKINDKNVNKVLDVCQDIFKEAISTTIKGNVKVGNTLIGANMIGHSLVTVLNILSKYSSTKTRSSVDRSIINSTKHKYDITIGKPTEGIFNNKGYTHMYNRVELYSTESSCQDTSSRLNLNTYGGINQKTIDILSSNTYLSLESLKTFISVSEVLKQALQRKNKFKEDNLKKGSKVTLAIKKNFVNSLTRERLYAGIRKHISHLKIYNTMPNHVTYVKIYVCCHKNFNDTCSTSDAETLKWELCKTHDVDSDSTYGKRYLKKTDLCKNIESHGSNSFKETIKVKNFVDIKKTEGWRNRITVLREISVPLLSSDMISLKLKHNYRYGIDVLELSDCQNSLGSSHTFFIVEAVGGGCQITSTEDKRNKRVGTSPIQLRYEFSHTLEYMCDKNDRSKPIIERIEERSNQFQDIFLNEQFYPTKEEVFNVDHNEIDIDGTNREAKWVLDIDAKTDQAYSILALQNKLIERDNISIDPQEINNITNNEEEEKEKEYSNSTSTLNKNKGHNKNLFGEIVKKAIDNLDDNFDNYDDNDDTIEDLD